MKKKGAPAAMVKHEKAEMMGMKKGGSVSSRADGVAKKGKTDTKMVKMTKGGRTC
jgi:hypothetical protein